MPSAVAFRPFAPSDLGACLAIFDSNCPQYLHPSERAEFSTYLTQHAQRANYLVGVLDDQIVACGGIFIDADTQAGYFAWGLVLNARHDQGIGRALTVQRIDMAKAQGIQTLHLDTSQHTQGFYAKLGFQPTGVTKDGYGPGLDRVDMVLTL